MSPVKRKNEYMRVELDELMAAIRRQLTRGFDLVVGIERGGVLPGYLAARYLDLPFTTIGVELRDDTHQKRYERPRVYRWPGRAWEGCRILLADDVSNSGETVAAARAELSGAASVHTLVISGNGDISLYGPHDRCIIWPWE
jgi:hypoxanthine phosphoribosyltransferase